MHIIFTRIQIEGDISVLVFYGTSCMIECRTTAIQTSLTSHWMIYENGGVDVWSDGTVYSPSLWCACDISQRAMHPTRGICVIISHQQYHNLLQYPELLSPLSYLIWPSVKSPPPSWSRHVQFPVPSQSLHPNQSFLVTIWLMTKSCFSWLLMTTIRASWWTCVHFVTPWSHVMDSRVCWKQVWSQ